MKGKLRLKGYERALETHEDTGTNAVQAVTHDMSRQAQKHRGLRLSDPFVLRNSLQATAGPLESSLVAM